ncbi:Bcgad1, partial [Apiospora arundinis]
RRFHDNCLKIIANLWHAGARDNPVGAATSGSSEAILVAMLALKRRWLNRPLKNVQERGKPNILVGAHAHVSIEVSAAICDVEVRVVDVCADFGYSLETSLLKDFLDSNTIGVITIVGNTYTGAFDPVAKVNDLLNEYQDQTGLDVPIHVDAASGGFVAPFLRMNIRWDFCIPRVVSINASGHKFGLVPAAVGWLVFRDKSYLSGDMMFQASYLQPQTEHFTISYSKPSSGVVIQYYYLMSLGRTGFELAISEVMETAAYLRNLLKITGWFDCVDIANPQVEPQRDHNVKVSRWEGLPVIAFSLATLLRTRCPEFTEAKLSKALLAKGYSVPCRSSKIHQSNASTYSF